jgi:hypothetical protein
LAFPRRGGGRKRVRERKPDQRRWRGPGLRHAGSRPELHRAARGQGAEVHLGGLWNPGGDPVRRGDANGTIFVAELDRRDSSTPARRPAFPGVPADLARRAGAGRTARSRGGERQQGRTLDGPAPQADPPPSPSRREDHHRREPGALYPRSDRERVDTSPSPRKRSGHGLGAGDARLLRRLGGPRRWLGRPRERRRERTGQGAARRGVLHGSPGVAVSGGGAGLLLRLLERGTLAAMSHRTSSSDLPDERLEALPGRESKRPTRTTRSFWCRTITSRWHHR